MNDEERVLYILGALAHLVSEGGAMIFGLVHVQDKIKSLWQTDITLREIVGAKKWLLDNELIEDCGIGYSLNELGEEYLRFKLPEFLPLPPMPDHDQFPALQFKFKQRRRRRT
ncbi:MAG: hypothetical protein WA082_00320 [Candidatus Moraniibacteriota bacterium]